MGVCTSVTMCLLPYAIIKWQGISLENFHELLEVVLFIVIAFILGFLVERERKKHTALVRAESLAVIGKAVSEIAHDMKTPLMVMGGFAGQVNRGLEIEDPNRLKLDIVIKESARLESMVKDMLDFGRHLKIHPKKTDLNELVTETVEMAKPIALEAEVELKVELDSSLPFFLFDGPRVKRVLLNLITNAIQASPEGEHVLIKTLLDGHQVVLKVIDHGCGITEEHYESIFHPFFSTKKTGAGLGLGIAKKIVEAHGGEVILSSAQEKGVTFNVYFPLKNKKVTKMEKRRNMIITRCRLANLSRRQALTR
ncbi:PAS domain-containing sensor histidine kinase [Thermodesulfobacteriota bacterium]